MLQTPQPACSARNLTFRHTLVPSLTANRAMLPGNQLDRDPFDMRAHFRVVCCFVTSAAVASAYNLCRNQRSCGGRPSDTNGLTAQCNWTRQDGTLLLPHNERKIIRDKAIWQGSRGRHSHIVSCCYTGRPPCFSVNREEGQKESTAVPLRLRHKNWLMLFLRQRRTNCKD